MKLIVGLGNPGQKYEHTRHNIGFICLDEIYGKNPDFSSWKSQFQGLVSQGKYRGEKVLLLKPMTFMNLSGQSISEAMSYYKISIEDICVVYDDVDMDFGKIRYRDTGSSGGHNGIKSIIGCLKTQDFARVKVGVGKHDHMATADWVLSSFSSEEKEVIRGSILNDAIDKVDNWIEEGEK